MCNLQSLWDNRISEKLSRSFSIRLAIDVSISRTGSVNVVDEPLGNARPQLLVFMLGGKASFDYMRIKKSADCRFGVVSQCMQNAHVVRGQGQYISNVLMKVNAKLGGATARVGGVSSTLVPFDMMI